MVVRRVESLSGVSPMVTSPRPSTDENVMNRTKVSTPGTWRTRHGLVTPSSYDTREVSSIDASGLRTLGPQRQRGLFGYELNRATPCSTNNVTCTSPPPRALRLSLPVLPKERAAGRASQSTWESGATVRSQTTRSSYVAKEWTRPSWSTGRDPRSRYSEGTSWDQVESDSLSRRRASSAERRPQPPTTSHKWMSVPPLETRTPKNKRILLGLPPLDFISTPLTEKHGSTADQFFTCRDTPIESVSPKEDIVEINIFVRRAEDVARRGMDGLEFVSTVGSSGAVCDVLAGLRDFRQEEWEASAAMIERVHDAINREEALGIECRPISIQRAAVVYKSLAGAIASGRSQPAKRAIMLAARLFCADIGVIPASVPSTGDVVDVLFRRSSHGPNPTFVVVPARIALMQFATKSSVLTALAVLTATVKRRTQPIIILVVTIVIMRLSSLGSNALPKLWPRSRTLVDMIVLGVKSPEKVVRTLSAVGMDAVHNVIKDGERYDPKNARDASIVVSYMKKKMISGKDWEDLVMKVVLGSGTRRR